MVFEPLDGYYCQGEVVHLEYSIPCLSQEIP
jgi:hypothetical protein